jgi:hypothetical protein
MKPYCCLLLLLITASFCHAQIFKKLGNRVKEEVEWRAQRKAGQKIDQGLDSLLAVPGKIIKKKGSKKEPAASTGQEPQAEGNDGKQNNKAGTKASSLKTSPAEEQQLSTKDGHITLKLSANKIFTGGSIAISGESVKYKNFTQVQVKVTGPAPADTRNITLTADGKYQTPWVASNKTGEYTVTVMSSDKKASQSATFTVEELELVFDDEWPEDNIKETQKALDRLEEVADKVKGNISPKNKAELEVKMGELKKQVDGVLLLFKDLSKANKEMGLLVRKGKALPPNLAGNLSALNDDLADQAAQMKKINEMADHEPPDNSICEYLVMLNEACAAFSTFTNVWAKTMSSRIQNIILDKAVPKAASEAQGAVGISAPADFPVKEATKIYATAKFDAKSLTETLGKAGIAGDILQFATEVLLKIYCEVFTGHFTHGYTIDFRNGKGETWWNYGVSMEAALTLRYPKKNISGTVIKMKGNLEGNATNFTFFEDIAKEDEFQEGSQGKLEVVPIKSFTPLAVSVATSERDILGFGAIARGLATPAYFNIVIDAEYDVDANTIKIFVDDALVDFMPWVANQFVFVLYGGDLIPWIKKMTFPIHKARLTINGVLKDQNEFPVKKDAKGNLSFEGKGSRHIGDATTVRETELKFTLSGKKE